MPRFLVLIAFLAVSSAPLAADGTRRAVPLSIDIRGGIAVEVRVNDMGPFRFILDTGAARSVVSDTLARQLGATAVAKSEIVTSAGSEMHLVVRLMSITVSPARLNNVLAPVMPDDRLAALGRDVRGLLGQDFLSAFNYTLDYRRGRLTWDGPLACDAPDAVRLLAAEGRYVMALEAGRFVPDSGAEVPVLFSASRPRQATSTLPRIRVGDVTMENVEAYLVERLDDNADGLLPLHHFAAVSFGKGGACLVARR